MPESLVFVGRGPAPKRQGPGAAPPGVAGGGYARGRWLRGAQRESYLGFSPAASRDGAGPGPRAACILARSALRTPFAIFPPLIWCARRAPAARTSHHPTRRPAGPPYPGPQQHITYHRRTGPAERCGMSYRHCKLPVSGPIGKRARRREAARLARRQGAARRSGKTRPAVTTPRAFCKAPCPTGAGHSGKRTRLQAYKYGIPPDMDERSRL
jgi:hypothetical protein